MYKKIIGLFIVMVLHGCATSVPDSVHADGAKQHALRLENGKTLSFKTLACTIKDGALSSNAAYASAGSYGTLVALNAKSQVPHDKYHFSCGALPAGGKSSCVIQHVEGNDTFNDYGGSGCPDIKFNVTSFRSF